MLRGYPTGSQVADSYLGALAELLMRYPRKVALECADPFSGVAAETRFLPTPADVIAFCDKRIAPLREELDRERRIDSQLQTRAAWKNASVSQSLVMKTKSWLDRNDPLAKQMAGITDFEIAEIERKKRVQADLELSRNSNEIEREWAASGRAAPAIAGLPVSKELAAIIAEDKNVA